MKVMRDWKPVLFFKSFPFRAYFGLLFICSVLACSTELEAPNSFGLSLIEISIEPEIYGELNNSVGAKRPFPASLTIDGEQYSVELSYAGKSTLYSYKKSWQVYFKNRLFRGRSELSLIHI